MVRPQAGFGGKKRAIDDRPYRCGDKTVAAEINWRTVEDDGPYGWGGLGEFAIKPRLPSVNFVEEFTGCVNGKHLTQGREGSIMAKL